MKYLSEISTVILLLSSIALAQPEEPNIIQPDELSVVQQKKFPIYLDFQLTSEAPGVNIQSIINEVEASADGLFVHTNNILDAKLVVHVNNELNGSSYDYRIWTNEVDLNGNQTHESRKFVIHYATTDPRQLSGVTKLIVDLATLQYDVDNNGAQPDQNDDVSNKRWSADIGIKGSFANSSKVVINGTGSTYAKGVASYDHVKVMLGGGLKYTYSKSPTFKGGALDVEVGTTVVYNFKKSGDKNDHWSIAVMTDFAHMPLRKNYDISAEIDLGAEWIMFPVYEDTQKQNFIVRVGFGGSYDDFHVKTQFEKWHQAYAKMFMNFYFVRYALQGRLKAQIGIELGGRLDMPKFGTYGITGGLSFVINSHVTFNTAFNLVYKPDGQNIPSDESFANDVKVSNFFNSYAGINSNESIGFTFTLGKSKALVRNKRNTRWVNP